MNSAMKYSGEFKVDTVALVRQSASQREVCRDPGVVKSTMSKWVTDTDRTKHGLPAARDVSSAEDTQICELMRRTLLLE